nr:MAG: coat protein [Leviviridae sp.]
MSITLASPAVVFTADTVREGAVVFNADSATLALPRQLTVRRVRPKPSGTYPGNARNYLKLHWNALISGVAYPIVSEIYISRPASMATSDTETVRDVMAALIADSELDAFFTSLSMPS